MKKLFMTYFILVMWAFSVAAQAGDHNLEQQLGEVQEKIEQEKVINAELKERLAARETEMSDMKLRLKSIEDQIAALKTEHNL